MCAGLSFPPLDGAAAPSKSDSPLTNKIKSQTKEDSQTLKVSAVLSLV